MFTTPLRLEATKPGHWRLLSDLTWDGDDFKHTVKEGTETDLASIPRLLRWLLQQNGSSRRPSVLHDDLYRTQIVPRAKADEIFRQALNADGVIVPGQFLYWAGVRVGGWIAWRSHAKKS